MTILTRLHRIGPPLLTSRGPSTSDMPKADTTSSDAPAPARNRLMSIVATAGLVIVVGSCCLCGGAVWQKQPDFLADPAAAAGVTGEILPVTVPAVFTPEGAIQWDLWMLVNMQGAYYTLTTGDGELSFLQVDSRFIDNIDFRDHIIRSLREHGAGGGFDLAVKATETRTYEVGGESVDFTFLKAQDRTTGRDRRLVDGIVSGPHGPVMISLWLDEENWDPQMVDDMIASIHTDPPANP